MASNPDQPLTIEVTSSPDRESNNNIKFGIPGSASNTMNNRSNALFPRKEAWGDNTAMGAAVTSTIAPTQQMNPVKSQSGSLSVYIHGFIKRKQDLRLKSVDPYNLECIIYPDESKFTSDTSQFTRLPSSIDFDGYCVYSKQINIPIAWALQQRKIAFLRFNLNTGGDSNNNNTNTNQRGGATTTTSSSKKTVAKYEFDLVSVLLHESKAFYGFLPLLSADRTLNIPNNTDPQTPIATSDLKFLASADNIFGWLFVGFKFIENSNPASNSIPPDLSTKSNTLWSTVVNSPSGSKWGLTSNVLRGPDTRPSEQFLVDNNSPPPSTLTLHIALSELQLTSIATKYVDGSTMTDTGFLVQITSMDHLSSAEVIGECGPNKVVKWNEEDVALTVIETNDFCIILEITVYKSVDKSISSLQLLGECKVKLPIEEILHGLPINLSLPLRDTIGIRSATLSLSLHVSNILQQQSNALQGANTAGSNPVVPTVSYLKYLKIECLEGNISLSDIHHYNFKSVYFECRLLFQNNTAASDMFKDWVSRTGYVNLFTLNTETTPDAVSADGIWNAVSRITLPNDIFMILQSVSNLETVSLCLDCKDASHMKGITIGRAKVSLPNGLFRNMSQGFEQWITLTKASNLKTGDVGAGMIMGNASSNNPNSNNPIGRVHLRLSLQQLLDQGFPSLDESQQGIGVFSCLINGINTSKSPFGVFENSLSSATITNSLILKNANSNGGTTTMYSELEEYETMKVDEKVCFPLSYQLNSLSMFTNSQAILAANTPIYCGNSEIQIKIRTDSSLNTFITKLPIMKVIPKTAESNELLTIQPVILSLMKKATSRQNPNGNAAVTPNEKMIASSGKIDPKLSISSCFIPFVEGRLFIQTDNITPILTGVIAPQSDDDATQYSVRYSMGTQAPRFAFSSVSKPEVGANNSVINSKFGSKAGSAKSGFKRPSRVLKKKGGSISSPPRPPKPTVVDQPPVPPMVELSIHTRELLLEEDESLLGVSNDAKKGDATDQTIQRKNFQVLLPLVLHVSTSTDGTNPANLVIDEENDDRLLIGLCYTAPLYIDALRKISSEGKIPGAEDESKNKQSTGEQNQDALIWRKVDIELYEKRTRRLAAVAHVRLAFLIEHIPHYVTESIEKLFYGKQNDVSSQNPDIARLELGLKQAFALADADNSRFVSSDELLKVIQDRSNDNSALGTLKKKPRSSRSSIVTLGMDNPGKLLFTLARKASTSSFATTLSSVTRTLPPTSTPGVGGDGEEIPDDFALIDPKTMNAMVQTLFKRLDVDGDGLISWWEWKSVLTALLCQTDVSSAQQNETENQKTTLRIDPIDPLLISFFAVSDILRCQDEFHRFSEELNLAKVTSTQLLPANYQGLLKQSNYVDTGSIISDNTFNFSQAPSKYSKKLTSMIKSLRQSNSLLTKRLEDAIVASQNILPTPNSPGQFSTNLPAPASPTEQLLQEQVEKLHEQSLNYYTQLSNVKHANQELQLQLSHEQNTTNLSTSLLQQDTGKLDLLHQTLHQQMTAYENQSHQKKLLKEKRFQAFMTLYRFFHHKVYPLYRKHKASKFKLRINHFLTSKWMHTHYVKHRQLRQQSALKIQKLYRGYMVRKQLKKRMKGVIILQNKYRQHLAKQIYHQKKEHYNLNQLIRMKLLAKAIKRLWRNYKKRKQANHEERVRKAKLTIFWSIFTYLHWRRFKRIKEQRQNERDLIAKRQHAALKIQFHQKKFNVKQRNKEIRSMLAQMKAYHQERCSLYFMKYKPLISTPHSNCLWMIVSTEFELHDDRHGVANAEDPTPSTARSLDEEENDTPPPEPSSPVDKVSIKSPSSQLSKVPSLPKPRQSKFLVKDVVEARYQNQHKWFPGVITSVTIESVSRDSSPRSNIKVAQANGATLYGVLYDDGDYEENVPEDLIRVKPPPSPKKMKAIPAVPEIHDYQVDDIVEAYFEEFDQWYRGKVHEITNKNTKKSYYIVYDDGDEEVAVLPERLRYFQKFSGEVIFKYAVGDSIEAKYKAGKDWFVGKVEAVHKDEDYGPVYDVLYEDGDRESMVKEYNIRRIREADAVVEEPEKKLLPEPQPNLHVEDESKADTELKGKMDLKIDPETQHEPQSQPFEELKDEDSIILPKLLMVSDETPENTEAVASNEVPFTERQEIEEKDDRINHEDEIAESEDEPEKRGSLTIDTLPLDETTTTEKERAETKETKKKSPQKQSKENKITIPMSSLTDKETPQLNEHNHFLRKTHNAYFDELHYFGKILSINQELRLMEVQYLANINSEDFEQLFHDLSNDSNFNKSTCDYKGSKYPHFFTRMIPFDHPHNIWYSTVPPDKSPRPVVEDVEEEPEPSFIPEPDQATPPEEESDEEQEENHFTEKPCDGYVPYFKDIPFYQYYYLSYSTDGSELYSNLGKVTDINEKDETIGVDFREEDERKAASEEEEKQQLESANLLGEPQKIREEKEWESKLKDEVKTPDSHSASFRKLQRELKKKPKVDKSYLVWISYHHPYMCWFDKNKEMLMPRKVKKTVANIAVPPESEDRPGKMTQKNTPEGKKTPDLKKLENLVNKSHSRDASSPRITSEKLIKKESNRKIEKIAESIKTSESKEAVNDNIGRPLTIAVDSQLGGEDVNAMSLESLFH